MHRPPCTRLLLSLEGEAVIENIYTTERADYVKANADNAVWLHTRDHTTLPTGVAPLARIHHTSACRGTWQEAPQGWTDRVAQMCSLLHEGLRHTSLTSHIPQPARTTAESDNEAAPPNGMWTYTRTRPPTAAEALKATISGH